MLEGQLVRLRAIEPEDSARVRAWLGDPGVTRGLTHRYPLSPDGGNWMSDAGANGFLQGVRLAIETKAGEHIGAVRLTPGGLTPGRASPEDRKASLGIVIGDGRYRGRGYGRDAVRAMCRFGFEEMNLHRIWLTVLADHERAIACYRACGFVEEVRQREEVYKDGRFRDFLVMGLLRPEFEATGEGGA